MKKVKYLMLTVVSAVMLLFVSCNRVRNRDIERDETENAVIRDSSVTVATEETTTPLEITTPEPETNENATDAIVPEETTNAKETTVTEEATDAKETTVTEEATDAKETTVTEATTGWIKDSENRWIYVDENTGDRVKGWFCSEASKRWYYLDEENGYMLSDSWFCNSGSNLWYYFGPDGALCTGWITVGGQQYYLDKNGAMCTGWSMLDGEWYLLGSDGAMCTGWQKVDGRYYYLTEQGKCLLNTTTPDGYRVDENGARID